MTFRISDRISIETVDISANIPIKSLDDFRLCITISFSEISLKAREDFIQEIQALTPHIKGSEVWGNYKNLSLSLEDKDMHGYCKHLFDLFENAGVPTSTMGSPTKVRGNKHPLLESSRIYGEILKPLESFESFKDFLVQALARAEQKTSFQAKLADEPPSSKSPLL